MFKLSTVLGFVSGMSFMLFLQCCVTKDYIGMIAYIAISCVFISLFKNTK